jgi:two-component system, OmpR family, response regulator
MKTETSLFLVDDDTVYLKLLGIELAQYPNIIVNSFATGELCMKSLSLLPDIIILDYHLDGIDKTAMNGIETLDKIKAIYPDLPVIMLSSQDKIDVAVNCMHHKAYDYVVKSETAFMRIEKIITTILLSRKTEKELNWYMERM